MVGSLAAGCVVEGITLSLNRTMLRGPRGKALPLGEELRCSVCQSS